MTSTHIMASSSMTPEPCRRLAPQDQAITPEASVSLSGMAPSESVHAWQGVWMLYYQRTYPIGAAARIEVAWNTDAYRLVFTPVRMTGHNAVNQLGEQVVQFPQRFPWVGTQEVIAVMLQLYREELAALRDVDPAFV